MGLARPAQKIVLVYPAPSFWVGGSLKDSLSRFNATRCLALATATLRTKFHLRPIQLPFFPPAKRPATARANFFRQIEFVMRHEKLPAYKNAIYGGGS
jgi:hypothetical protein